jgi:putative oxidoreductase
MGLDLLVLVGRLLIGGAFLVSGIRLLKYLPMVSGMLAAKGVPYPRFVAAAGGVFEVVMGLVAMSGVWFPVVTIALAVFIVAATVMAHDFWNEEGMQRFADINAMIANTIIVGALLTLAGLSP